VWELTVGECGGATSVGDLLVAVVVRLAHSDTVLVNDHPVFLLAPRWNFPFRPATPHQVSTVTAVRSSVVPENGRVLGTVDGKEKIDTRGTLSLDEPDLLASDIIAHNRRL
jgi:hypothetical protein